jgi:hypothetical protein
MTQDEFVIGLKQLLTVSDEADRRFVDEQAEFRQIAGEQRIQLAIGRLKIDAARAALESRLAARRVRS